MAMLLRPGKAGSNTATDHERAIKEKDALKKAPGVAPAQLHKRVMIRTLDIIPARDPQSCPESWVHNKGTYRWQNVMLL